MFSTTDARKQILCVEPHEDTSAMLRVLLGGEGCVVVTACDFDDALRRARSHRFDLYLLENVLPDVTGVELCREIRALDAKAPVVFFSSDARPETRRGAFEAGAQAYILKPESIHQLTEVVGSLLDPRKPVKDNVA